MLSELQYIIASLVRASCGGPQVAAGLPACGRRLALAVLFCALAPLAAVDYTWVGGTGTNWSTDANWNPSTGHPTAADDTATFTAGANDCTVDAPVSITTISLQAGYSGTLSQGGSTITVGAGGFSQAGGTFTGGGAGITVTGDLTISGGTFTSTSGSLALSGNLTRSGTGVFTHNSGTVALTGADQVISGSNTFNQLSKTTATACTLTFAAGSTQTVTGALTLQGASGQAVSLRSTSPGTRWNLDAQGARTLAFLDVMDSNNSNATIIDCRANGSVDAGNNVKWMFATPTAFTWTGTTNNNFNTGTNWYGGAVPGSTSDAVFSGVYPVDCTVNANANVKGVTIAAGYLGTITQGAFTITVGSTGWNQAGGTFTGSASSIALNGPYALSGGTFTSTSGTLTHNGATWTSNTGTPTFNGNGGKVVFYRAIYASTTVASGSVHFNNVDLSYEGSGGGLNVTGDMYVDGTLQMVQRSYTCYGLISGTIQLAGNLSMNSTLVSGDTYPLQGTVRMMGTGNQTISSVTNGGILPQIAVDKPSGTLILSGTNTVHNWTWTNGTLDATGSTLVILVKFGTPITVTPGAASYNNVNISVSGGSTIVTVSGTWDINGNFYPYIRDQYGGCKINTGTINVAGNLTATQGAQAWGASTCSIVMDGTGTISTTGDVPCASLTINTAGTITAADSLDLNRSGSDLFVTAGTLDLAGYNATINDQFTIGASGILKLQGGETLSKAPTANVGAVEYTGDGAGTAVTLKNWTYSTLSIASTTGTPSTFSLPAALTVSGNLSRSGGTLDATASNYNLSLGGNWLASGGSFTARAATVTLAANTSHTITGSSTFNNLNHVSTAADTLTFEAGSTQTVGGTLTLQGASGNRLRLRSTTPGSPWKLAASGSRACTWLDVQDSTSLVAPLILPSNSLDSLRNVGWFSPLIGLCWGPGTSGTADGTTDPVAWVLGNLPLGTTRTSGQGADAATTFAVRNVSDQAVQLTATAGSSGWTIATLPGPDRCWLGLGDGSGAGPFTSLDSATSPGGVVLGGNLPVSGVRAFDLQLKTPIATTTAGTTTTLTVTLTASPP